MVPLEDNVCMRGQVWEQWNDVPRSRYSCYLLQFGLSEHCISKFDGCSTCNDWWCRLLAWLSGLTIWIKGRHIFDFMFDCFWLVALLTVRAHVQVHKAGYLVPGTSYMHLKSVTFTIMLQLPLSGTYLFKMKMSTLVQTHIFMCRYKYFRKWRCL